MKKPKPFATEVALCARFIAAIGPDWTAYPETAGWDILLVRKADGFQIGVQAKLRFGTDVINQAIENGHRAEHAGPDCRAVLVPWGDAGAFSKICGFIGLTVVRVTAPGANEKHVLHRKTFEPELPSERTSWSARDWFEWHR